MKATITNEHSTHKPTETIELKLIGGSPYYEYIWINDVCYTVVFNDDSEIFEITPTKFIEY